MKNKEFLIGISLKEQQTKAKAIFENKVQPLLKANPSSTDSHPIAGTIKNNSGLNSIKQAV